MIVMLENGDQLGPFRVLLGHGAGAAMTSPFLEQMTTLLAERGLAVTRFEFSYMAARRSGGPKRPPPRAENLMPEFLAAIAQVKNAMPKAQKLFVGGKSLGGRVASMIADEVYTRGEIAGLICLGYPFHAPTQPGKMRTAHLEKLTCPALIVQGDRDPFGNRSEIEAVTLSPAIQLHWLGDGDHDFGPRGASGFTRKGNLTSAADAVAQFVAAPIASR